MDKKVFIAVLDMEIGGIERSLINMLQCFDYEQYEVDLFICRHVGELMAMIPEQVNILPEMRPYTALQKSIMQCVKEGHVIAAAVRLWVKCLTRLLYRKRQFAEGSGFVQMQWTHRLLSNVLPRLPKQYDVAISYDWPHHIVARNVKAKRKVAWIHTDYSTLGIDNKHDHKVWQSFDYIASISPACEAAFLKQYPDLKAKIIQIENITSPQFIHQMTEEQVVFQADDPHAAAPFHIVSVGRLSYAKGFDLAIKALRLLHDRGYTEMKWYVIGYGGQQSLLSELISKYRLEESFILLGKQLNPYPYMKACDLYVQPSRYEGKAVTVTEAQILGKPIVITNYPTASSQIEDGIDGYICDLSAEGIAAGIERLYRDQALRERLAANVKLRQYSNNYELNKLYDIIV